MKLLLIFFLLMFDCAIAQNELYIPWTNVNISIEGRSHATDNEGNIYILGVYDIENNGGKNTITKIDKGNHIVWKKQYENNYPGGQIVMLDSSVFITYSLYVGYSNCYSTPDSGARISSINAGMLINARTGDTIKTKIFFDGKKCGHQGIYYTYIDENALLNNLYVYDSFLLNATGNRPHYMLQNDWNLNMISDSLFYPLNSYEILNGDAINTIVYDSFTHGYIIADKNGLHIYDKHKKKTKDYLLSTYNALFSDIGYVTIAYNRTYYVVNFLARSRSSNPISYLIVINKDGTLISANQSLLFTNFTFKSDDIVLTANNEIFGIGAEYDGTLSKQLTLVEMDLFQNIKKKKNIGKANVVPDKLTVTSDREIVISGTYQRGWDNIPMPDLLYYYREKLDDIMLLQNSKNLCSSINIYPNPITNSINISSTDFNFTHNSSVEIYNIIGQKLHVSVFDNKTLTIDLSRYSDGIYLIKTQNNNASCISKIQKQ